MHVGNAMKGQKRAVTIEIGRRQSHERSTLTYKKGENIKTVVHKCKVLYRT